MSTIDLKKMLDAEHARLEQLFQQLVRAFEADAREDTQALWRELENSLSAHMAEEERLILPVFSTVNPHEAVALEAEHASLRRLLGELGVAAQLHCLRADVAKAFIETLRAHAQRENALLYTWAQRQLSETSRAAIFSANGQRAAATHRSPTFAKPPR